jgi:hypothetical protein
MAIDEITPLGDAAPLGELLAAAEPLTLDERRLIVRQAQLMIEQLYVHLPLKRAMHAVDPLQRLRLLDRRLASYSDRRFHDEMISIFIGLRDLHTNYILPAPYAGRTAVLPFRIEAYEEPSGRHYIVSQIAQGFTADPPFRRRRRGHALERHPDRARRRAQRRAQRRQQRRRALGPRAGVADPAPDDAARGAGRGLGRRDLLRGRRTGRAALRVAR